MILTPLSSMGLLSVEPAQHHDKALAVFMYSYFTSKTNELNAALWSLAGDKRPSMLQQDDTKCSQISLSPSRALHLISPAEILGKSTLWRRDQVNLELNQAFHSAIQQYRSESTRKEVKQRQNLCERAISSPKPVKTECCLFRTPCGHSRPASTGNNHLTEALLRREATSQPDICISVRYLQSLNTVLKIDEFKHQIE